MRILVLHNRIYRAFPELDPYTDERCIKFLRAAEGHWLRRLLRGGASFVVFAVVLAGGLSGTALAIDRWFGGVVMRSWVAAFGPFLIPICAAPVGAFLARDFLLRRRVRWVLRTRGTCPACRYSLVGLPVNAAHHVTCPECALEVEVDPSLGELVLDESGRGRFSPSIRAFPRPPRIFTPKRVRFLKRAAIIAALVLGMVLPALWGGYELFLRRQAAAALAAMTGTQTLQALVAASQPPGSEGGANAWDLFQDAATLKGQTDFADEQQNPPPAGKQVWADFGRIYSPDPRDDADTDAAAQNALDEAKASRLLSAYRSAGVYDALDRMARAPRSVQGEWPPQGQPITNYAAPWLSEMRQFVQVNAARMKLAQDQGDLQEFASSLEANLAIVRVAMHQPTLIDAYVGVAIESHVYWRLGDFLLVHPARDWLDAVDAAIARQQVNLPKDYWWEGECLAAQDYIAWVFSDPGRVRWGPPGPEVQAGINPNLTYSGLTGSLGTYAENRDAVNAYYRAAAKIATQPRCLRSPSPASLAPASDLLLVQLLTGDLDMRLRGLEVPRLAASGYTVEAALERYYALHAAYPASLADLVPDCIPQLPPDPWTGKTWGYHLRPPDAPTEDPRGYILYSFGSDGQDDGGLASRNQWGAQQALFNATPGHDYVINDWTPPEK